MKNYCSSYIVTCNIDWAADWMLEKVFEILPNYKVTYFITNDTPLQREHEFRYGAYKDLFLVGLLSEDFFKSSYKIRKEIKLNKRYEFIND